MNNRANLMKGLLIALLACIPSWANDPCPPFGGGGGGGGGHTNHGFAVWRASNGTGQAVHAIDDPVILDSTTQYQLTAGYNLIDLEVILVNGTTYYSAIYETGATAQVYYLGMTQSNLATTHATLSTQGYAMVDIETYVVNGARFFAAVWHANASNHPTQIGVTARQLFNENTNQEAYGYGMDDLEAWEDNGTILYAAIWTPGNAGRTYNDGQDRASFFYTVENNAYAGLQLVDVDSFNDNGTTYYTGIWESATAETTHLIMANCDEMIGHFDTADLGNGYVMTDFEVINDVHGSLYGHGGGACDTSNIATTTRSSFILQSGFSSQKMMPLPSASTLAYWCDWIFRDKSMVFPLPADGWPDDPETDPPPASE